MSATNIKIDRRFLLKSIGLGTASLATAGCTSASRRLLTETFKERPNILWISCEDVSPNLGCYGDTYAVTPNLDRLAADGLLYENAFATAPVCAPARSCLITGMYATSLGTQHLRSNVRLPEHIRCFSEHLRDAGYYCSNNYKQDYNFTAKTAWDESSKMAHWRKRKGGQPFFCVFNLVTEAPLPPYYPDTPVVRETMARYYDLITLMDKEAGHLLQELAEDRLADDTIVFFFSDHGFGLPRFKRTLYDSGLRVPLIIRLPAKYQHLAPLGPGNKVDDLVSFVDFAPTVLSLARVQIPKHMQGRAFLGTKKIKPRQYVFGAASRVDEMYELSRCVRDKRYKYIRNYMPHLPYSQPSAWPDQARIMKELRRLAVEGKLAGAQKFFALQTKPIEELYDTQADPHEINNLAGSAQHQHTLERMRQAHKKSIADTHDIGFLPEAEMHIRAKDTTPQQIATNPSKYNQQRIVAAAELVGKGPESLPKMVKLLNDFDSAVRYWAAVALNALGPEAGPAADALEKGLGDPQPNVRFAAAGALCKVNRCKEALSILVEGLQDERPCVVLCAARELQNIGDKACPALSAIEQAKGRGTGGLYEMFIRWALEGTIRNCQP